MYFYSIQGFHCDMIESKCIFWAEEGIGKVEGIGRYGVNMNHMIKMESLD